MSVAETARPRVRVREGLGWPAALAGLFLGSLILRLVGISTGLPYVYNADENSHFVPRAIGMFGHSLNPDYFVNPPAYTYLVHALYTLRWGTNPATVGGAYAADPTAAFEIARAASATLGALAVVLTAIAAARLFDDRRVGIVAGALLGVAFLPVHYSHFALNDAPTLAPLALALVGVADILSTSLDRPAPPARALLALGFERRADLGAARAGARRCGGHLSHRADARVPAGRRRPGGGDRDQVHGGDHRPGDRGRGARLARRPRPLAQPGDLR